MGKPEDWKEIHPDATYDSDVEVGRYIKKGVWVLTHLQSPIPGWALVAPNDYYTHFRKISPPSKESTHAE